MQVRERRLTFVAVTLVCAASSSIVWGSPRTDQGQDELTEAVRLIGEGQFTDAEILLRELLEARPETAEACLYIAVAIVRQEDTARGRLHSRLPEAERWCSAALQHNDGLVAARLLRARVRAALGRRTLARLDLERVQRDVVRAKGRDDSGAGLTDVSDLLEDLDRELRPWDLSIQLGLSYDTNVPQIGRSVGLPQVLGRKRDWRTGVGANLTYRLLEDDNLELGIGGGAFASWHSDLDVFDEQIYSASAYVRSQITQSVEGGISYDYSFGLLGREDYLSRHRLVPYLAWIQTHSCALTLYYEFDTRRFFDVPAVESSPTFDRSGDSHAFGVVERFVLANPLKRLSVANPPPREPVTFDIGYRHENVSTRGTEFDTTNNMLIAALTLPIAQQLDVHVGGTWSWEDYKRRSSLDRHGRGRRDFVQTYSLAISREIGPCASIQGFILWTDDDSNVVTKYDEDVFTYSRVIYGVSVQLEF